MFKIALIALAVIVVLFIAVVALQPTDFRIARRAIIPAPPAVVFAQVNDFHNWPTWSPWARLDPAMRQSYAGAPAGTGAIYTWAGNDEVGEGRSTITISRPTELIRIKLEFVRPFTVTNDVEFTFQPEGDGTAVTWSMTGQKNFIAKAVHLFMDMDAMVGGQFETGLAQLRTAVEGAPKSP